MRTLIAAAVVLMAWLVACDAHDHNAPELDAWYKSLENQRDGACCDGSDAKSVLDPDWDTTTDPDNPYKVKVDGVWFNVPAWAVVKQTNKVGVAKVWPIYPIDDDGAPSGEPASGVRCFMPGAGA